MFLPGGRGWTTGWVFLLVFVLQMTVASLYLWRVLLSSDSPNGPGALSIGNGGLFLLNSTINTAVTDQGPINVRSSSTINGAFSIAPTGVLTLDGFSGCGGTSQLTVANGFTNQGQISLRTS